MQLQQEIAQEVNAQFLNKELEVLIDEVPANQREEAYLVGRSQADAPEVDGVVYVKESDSSLVTRRSVKPGDFVRVKIVDTLEYDLVGEIR